jgi:hypothetical protein
VPEFNARPCPIDYQGSIWPDGPPLLLWSQGPTNLQAERALAHPAEGDFPQRVYSSVILHEHLHSLAPFLFAKTRVGQPL